MINNRENYQAHIYSSSDGPHVKLMPFNPLMDPKKISEAFYKILI